MDIKDAASIVIFINKLNIAIEALILLQYFGGLYLTRTGPIKNGVERGMSWMFAASITYHLAVIAALVAVNMYYTTYFSEGYVLVSILLCANRLFLFGANAYLFHMLREHTRLLDKVEIQEEVLDVRTN